MRKRMNLYKVVDQNGKQVFENLLTAKQVTEKTGCTKNNVAQAAANFALVNKKYRIIPEDIKLSKALDVELLAEWDRYRKWMLRAAGRGEWIGGRKRNCSTENVDISMLGIPAVNLGAGSPLLAACSACRRG